MEFGAKSRAVGKLNLWYRLGFAAAYILENFVTSLIINVAMKADLKLSYLCVPTHRDVLLLLLNWIRNLYTM